MRVYFRQRPKFENGTVLAATATFLKKGGKHLSVPVGNKQPALIALISVPVDYTNRH
jgi:hypothetical protein